VGDAGAVGHVRLFARTEKKNGCTFHRANVLHLASKEVAFHLHCHLWVVPGADDRDRIVRTRGWGWAGLSRALAAAAGVLAVLILGSATQLAVLIMRDLGPCRPAQRRGGRGSRRSRRWTVTINFVIWA